MLTTYNSIMELVRRLLMLIFLCSTTTTIIIYTNACTIDSIDIKNSSTDEVITGIICTFVSIQIEAVDVTGDCTNHYMEIIDSSENIISTSNELTISPYTLFNPPHGLDVDTYTVRVYDANVTTSVYIFEQDIIVQYDCIDENAVNESNYYTDESTSLLLSEYFHVYMCDVDKQPISESVTIGNWLHICTYTDDSNFIVNQFNEIYVNKNGPTPLLIDGYIVPSSPGLSVIDECEIINSYYTCQFSWIADPTYFDGTDIYMEGTVSINFQRRRLVLRTLQKSYNNNNNNNMESFIIQLPFIKTTTTTTTDIINTTTTTTITTLTNNTGSSSSSEEEEEKQQSEIIINPTTATTMVNEQQQQEQTNDDDDDNNNNINQQQQQQQASSSSAVLLSTIIFSSPSSLVLLSQVLLLLLQYY